MSLDPLDLRLLSLLQENASLSNAELGERIGLSASQCSRRRAGLEEAGYIRAYRADLDARKLGYGIEAFTRVTLSKHSDATAEDFAHFKTRFNQLRRFHLCDSRWPGGPLPNITATRSTYLWCH